VFAEEVIHILLGPKWSAAVPIFQLLAPTVLVFGLINPMGWLLFSLGYQKRSLALALVISPIVITAYIVGLPYGPTGVALAYSTAMTLWLVPHILWCLRGTLISPTELVLAISPPLLSALAAAAVGFLVDKLLDSLHASMATAALAAGIMGGTYVFMLFVVFAQKSLFLDVLRDLRGRAAPAPG